VAKLMTHSQKKRPEIKEILCYPKMMDMKSNYETDEQGDDAMLKTIKFPPNLKNLNQHLPKAKYESKCKTAKLIPEPDENIKVSKSTVKLPLPSLKQITSEKNLILPPSQKHLGEHGTLARKPRVLNKNGSQKLIF